MLQLKTWYQTIKNCRPESRQYWSTIDNNQIYYQDHAIYIHAPIGSGNHKYFVLDHGINQTVLSAHKYLLMCQITATCALSTLSLQSVSGIGIISGASIDPSGGQIAYFISNKNLVDFAPRFVFGFKTPWPVDEDITMTFKNFMLFDLTNMYGAGNEPATLADFRNRCPGNFYEYNLFIKD